MPDPNTDKAKSSGTSAGRAATSAVKPATAQAAPPVVAAPTSAGAAASTDEENPLHKKLRLRPGDNGVVIAPPQDDDNPLLPLPKSFSVLPALSDLASSKGPFDYIHVFARDKAELAEAFSLLREKLRPGGSLWVSWLKLSSRRGGTSQAFDLNENLIRRLGLTHGLVDVNLVPLDRDWSALRLVHRKR